MNGDDALRLTQALDALTEAVKQGCDSVTGALQEMDESIATLVGRKLEDNEQVPTAGQVVEKIADFGAKAVFKALMDWERKLQGST